jgi:uncharacterized membrane protein
MKKLILSIIFLLLFFSSNVNASGINKYKAYIINKTEIECEEEKCIEYELEIVEGEKKGEIVKSNISSFSGIDPDILNYNLGDQVFIQQLGEDVIFILGPVRELPLLVLGLLFVVVTVLVGKLNGLGALAGLFTSMFALFGIVSPMILSGGNAFIATYIGAVLILVTSIFFSHGINRKTIIAIVSSIIGLLIISILAVFFIELIKLTGLGSDNALQIISQSGSNLDIKGIFYASIILGGVGVLDDITINQVSALEQIYLTDPKQTTIELYRKAMLIGKDHIASLVNTLFIAYASASLPLVMLLQSTDSSFLDILNSDQFAEEIVRAVIGSIGLILVVPVSSIIASYYITKVGMNKKEIKKLKDENKVHVH